MGERVGVPRALWGFGRHGLFVEVRCRRCAETMAQIERYAQSILVCAGRIQRRRSGCKLVAEFNVMPSAVVASRGPGMSVSGIRAW